MRFKLDENLPSSLAALFAHGGHDVATVHDEGLSGTPDRKVFEVAVAEARTLVTLDLDYANPTRFRLTALPESWWSAFHVRRSF